MFSRKGTFLRMQRSPDGTTLLRSIFLLSCAEIFCLLEACSAAKRPLGGNASFLFKKVQRIFGIREAEKQLFVFHLICMDKLDGVMRQGFIVEKVFIINPFYPSTVSFWLSDVTDRRPFK